MKRRIIDRAEEAVYQAARWGSAPNRTSRHLASLLLAKGMPEAEARSQVASAILFGNVRRKISSLLLREP